MAVGPNVPSHAHASAHAHAGAPHLSAEVYSSHHQPAVSFNGNGNAPHHVARAASNASLESYGAESVARSRATRRPLPCPPTLY
eukprot:364184-Chlamydomonas_euryale.AAC.3